MDSDEEELDDTLEEEISAVEQTDFDRLVKPVQQESKPSKPVVSPPVRNPVRKDIPLAKPPEFHSFVTSLREEISPPKPVGSEPTRAEVEPVKPVHSPVQ